MRSLESRHQQETSRQKSTERWRCASDWKHQAPGRSMPQRGSGAGPTDGNLRKIWPLGPGTPPGSRVCSALWPPNVWGIGRRGISSHRGAKRRGIKPLRGRTHALVGRTPRRNMLKSHGNNRHSVVVDYLAAFLRQASTAAASGSSSRSSAPKASQSCFARRRREEASRMTPSK